MKVSNLIWIILLIIYIFSPWDLHPSLLDDVVALLAMLALWYNKRPLFARRVNPGFKSEAKSEPEMNSLEQAYQCLNILPDATESEIKKAYHQRMAENHPDKVNHLSEELKQHAHKMVHKIQSAYELIMQHKGK